jgi:hypothetical protein
MKKFLLFIFILIIFISISCDELLNPSSDYIVEKKVQASTDEQILESGNDFKIIFPANAISGNLEVKVKKESSAPDIGNANLKAPNSFYKIKFSGDGNFQKPVQVIINFDKSSIPAGKKAQESVFGYIYSSGTWKLANYQLDEQNSKIIITISSINGKIIKDEPLILDDGEIIIGGFSTVDKGQSDNGILSTFSYFIMEMPFVSQRTQKYDDVTGSLIKDTTTIGLYDFRLLSTLMKHKSKWINNQFIINFDTTAPGYKWKYNVSIKLSDDLKSIKEFFCFYERQNFYGYSSILTSSTKIQFKCLNIPFSHIYGQDYFYFIKTDKLNESFIIDYFTSEEYTTKGVLVESITTNILNYNNLNSDYKQQIILVFEKD